MTRFPSWLKVQLPSGESFNRIKAISAARNLHTVCEEARCPNIAECWGGGTATFMVLGESCTRGCRFCAVETAKLPSMPDPQEPQKLAETLAEMGLEYAVITTVCRDDLPDQGAGHIARCIAEVKKRCPHILVEVLIQDFRGDTQALETVLAAGPDVLAHNLETVERLTQAVRDVRAGYRQSLNVLRQARLIKPGTPVKSSLMLGLGESEEEILQALRDLRQAGVTLVTLGQYLRPSSGRRFLPVARHVPPQEFQRLGQAARAMGFGYVASGPLVRSSYRAGELFLKEQLLTTHDRVYREEMVDSSRLLR